jgi:hypothetical protein
VFFELNSGCALVVVAICARGCYSPFCDVGLESRRARPQIGELAPVVVCFRPETCIAGKTTLCRTTTHQLCCLPFRASLLPLCNEKARS